MSAVLDVTGVSKQFDGQFAVSDVSISVVPGETLAIIGPNGAGKSTLFGLIAGEYRNSSGSIRFDGADISRWSAHRRAREGMSRTFQVARLFSTRTVTEHLNLALSAKAGRHRMLFDDFASHSQRGAERVDAVLDRLKLSAVATRNAADLAQGDRKRLELAMAIIQDPKVLLLDEPTAGMSNEDCDLTVELLTAIKQRDPQLAIVMTGHDMHVLLALASRVVLMAEGKKVLDGDADEVRSSPQARQLYLGEIDD